MTMAQTTENRPDVDPQLLSVIRDAEAPLSYAGRRVEPPATLPGRLGVLEAVRDLLGALRHGADYYLSERAKLGDLYRGMSGVDPAVFVWDVEQAHRALRNEDGAWSTALGWDALVLGRVSPAGHNTGLLMGLDFQRHRDARKLVQSAFTPRATKGYLDIARPPIEAAIAKWTSQRRLAFKPAVRAMLAQVANEIFTGFASSSRRDEVDRALTGVWNGVFALSSHEWLSPSLRRARAGFRYLSSEFQAEMPLRRKQPGSDLLSQLALAGDASGKDDAALTGILTGIMFGAYDTTSLAVTSMVYFLAKFPHWQERLRAEAQRLDAREWADLQQMEELDWVWKETLRLMLVTGALPRRTLRDLELDGHRVRAGTVVWLFTGAHGRNQALWSDALSFDPERFSPARAKELPRYGHAPFGAGPHACIGTQLATFETRLLIHGLLTRSRFTLVKDVGMRHTFGPLGCVQGNVELNITPLA